VYLVYTRENLCTTITKDKSRIKVGYLQTIPGGSFAASASKFALTPSSCGSSETTLLDRDSVSVQDRDRTARGSMYMIACRTLERCPRAWRKLAGDGT
jgi:hypothetical protein